MDITIDKEMAEAEFQRFAECARLDLDEPRNENDRRSLFEERERMIYNIQKGRVTVDDDGYPTVNTYSEEIPRVRFTRRPTGNTLLSIDKVKKNDEAAKMFVMLAGVTTASRAELASLEQPDIDLLGVVFGLFLG